MLFLHLLRWLCFFVYLIILIWCITFTDFFSDVKTILQSWHKSHLVIFCDYFCMLDSVVSILWVFFMSILTRDIILCFSCDLLVSFCCQDNTEAIWAWAFFSVGNFKMTNSIPLLLYVCSNLLFLFEPISLVCSQDFILFMIFYLLPYNCL